MTMNEWLEFNKDIFTSEDVDVILFSKPSMKKADVMLHTIIRLTDAVDLFGDKELHSAGINVCDGQPYFRFILWPQITEVPQIENE